MGGRPGLGLEAEQVPCQNEGLEWEGGIGLVKQDSSYYTIKAKEFRSIKVQKRMRTTVSTTDPSRQLLESVESSKNGQCPVQLRIETFILCIYYL